MSKLAMAANIIRHPIIAAQGLREFRSGCGMTYGDDRDEAYDFGREVAHRITLRRWDH